MYFTTLLQPIRQSIKKNWRMNENLISFGSVYLSMFVANSHIFFAPLTYFVHIFNFACGCRCWKVHLQLFQRIYICIFFSSFARSISSQLKCIYTLLALTSFSLCMLKLCVAHRDFLMISFAYRRWPFRK